MTNEVHMHAASTHGKTAPDLTPAEARAEIEAFMGDGWKFGAHASNTGYYAYAHRPDFAVRVDGLGPTFRAAVSALKQAWRDAVRPWMQKADEQAFAEGFAYEKYRKQRTTQGERISRVLKEYDHEV